MPTITVKNIPAEIYEKLKRAAEANHRSINSEIIACIERTVGTRQIDPDALVAEARALRAQVAGPPITDREFTRAKAAGRS
ncbi:MAG TPA: Arc family DNA-binding protein [Sedimentisphaerales bacterium]|nr:Arc family DNA-binding protein [Sedimentisphaerales bacterium]